MEKSRKLLSEAEWLDQFGGRTKEDVFVDGEGKKYITLLKGRRGTEKFYLPERYQIKK